MPEAPHTAKQTPPPTRTRPAAPWAASLALVLSGAALTAAWFGGVAGPAPRALAQSAPPAPSTPPTDSAPAAAAPAAPPRMITRVEYVPVHWVYNTKTQLNDDADLRKTIDLTTEVLKEAEEAGWQLTQVTPLVLPVYRFKADNMSQWAFGLGASMTRGYMLYFQKPVP